MASINYAERIQHALLPKDGDLDRGFPEHFVFFRPRDVVSGDFYWFDVTQGKAILVIADCTGHGVPGAFMSLLGNDAISSAVVRLGLTSPDEILQYIDAAIYSKLQQGTSNNQDGMDASVLVYHLDSGLIEFAGAKRPLIIANSQGVKRYKGNKFSIAGKLPKQEKTFSKEILSLEEPSTLYMFSDGYPDQFGGDQNMKFSTRRLYNLFESCCQKPILEQEAAIEQAFESWKGYQRQIDDVLVVGIRLTPKNQENSA